MCEELLYRARFTSALICPLIGTTLTMSCAYASPSGFRILKSEFALFLLFNSVSFLYKDTTTNMTRHASQHAL
jgi:hypothetical protein